MPSFPMAKDGRNVLALSVLRAALCLLPLLLAAPGENPRAAETGDLDALRARALELVNQARDEQGLEPLETGERLDAAAQAHAEDMLARGYYGHASPEGETVMDRYVEAGGRPTHLAAENIARCAGCPAPPTLDDVERLHAGWMDSPSHRENILAPGITRFGFGIVAETGKGQYAVQTFAGPGTPRTQASGEEAEPIPPRQIASVALDRINDARRDAGVPPLEPSGALGEAARSSLPGGDMDGFSLDQIGNPLSQLSPDRQREWRAVATVAGECGGCGTEPTAADVGFFIDQWLGNPQYRERLLDPGFTDAGFALRADGDGRKIALLTLGGRR